MAKYNNEVFRSEGGYHFNNRKFGIDFLNIVENKYNKYKYASRDNRKLLNPDDRIYFTKENVFSKKYFPKISIQEANTVVLNYSRDPISFLEINPNILTWTYEDFGALENKKVILSSHFEYDFWRTIPRKEITLNEESFRGAVDTVDKTIQKVITDGFRNSLYDLFILNCFYNLGNTSSILRYVPKFKLKQICELAKEDNVVIPEFIIRYFYEREINFLVQAGLIIPPVNKPVFYENN